MSWTVDDEFFYEQIEGKWKEVPSPHLCLLLVT
jgi:hypothetical protein